MSVLGLSASYEEHHIFKHPTETGPAIIMPILHRGKQGFREVK